MPFPYTFPFYFDIECEIPPDILQLWSLLNGDAHLTSWVNDDMPMLLSPLKPNCIFASRINDDIPMMASPIRRRILLRGY